MASGAEGTAVVSTRGRSLARCHHACHGGERHVMDVAVGPAVKSMPGTAATYRGRDGQ